MKFKLEFTGGLELLFGKVKKHNVELSGKESVPLKDVLQWVKENLLKERPELFLSHDTVRPGILVLVNDCDWELVGGLSYEVKEGDELVMISTLHGG